MMALSMSVVALAIDTLLPAHGLIGAEFAVARTNDTQYIVYSLFLGLGLGQLFFGPLADAIGRRPAVLWGLALFALGTLVSLFAEDYAIMLIGRFLQGIGVSAPRVLTITIVRDLFVGRQMARMMSFVASLFILVPAIAPALGQGLILLSGWRSILLSYLVLAAALSLWFVFRQPETLATQYRQSLAPGRIIANIGVVIGTPAAVGFTLAATANSSAFIAFLGTAQQVFVDQYGLGNRFPLAFGLLALSIGISMFINGKIVLRLGMRWLATTAAIMTLVTSIVYVGFAVYFDGHPPLWILMPILMLLFMFIGFLFGNLNALAMEPLGHLAGTAAAVIGAFQTVVSAVFAAIGGEFYNGSVTPLASIFAGWSVVTLITVVVSDRLTRAAPAGPGSLEPEGEPGVGNQSVDQRLTKR